MPHNLLLYAALSVFAIGMLYRVSSWFRFNVGPRTEAFSPWFRVGACMKGIALTVFSSRILSLVKVLFLDVVVQRRVMQQGYLRWIAHICISWGFILLLLMHALSKITSVALFS